MINKTLSQKGNAHIIIIVILVIALIGALGFVFWQNVMKKDSPHTDSTQNQPKTSNTDNKKTELFSLLDGKVTFKNDKAWKTATGGYYSKESGKCGQGADSNAVCLDHLMLIPSNETFTNPDQFQVNIGVFDGTDLSPQEWLMKNADQGGENAKTSISKINGFDSYRYEVNYGDNETRLSYAIKLDKNIVLVSSILFNGDHYSYKNDKDYRSMIKNVDELVGSIDQ